MSIEFDLDPNLPEPSEQDLITAYFVALGKATQFVNQNVNPRLKEMEANQLEAALSGSFFRLHLCAESILRLNHPSCFQSVAAIARTMLELTVDLEILIKDSSEKNIEKFTNFRNVAVFRSARRILENEAIFTPDLPFQFMDHQPAIEFAKDENRRTRIEAIVERLWGRNRKEGLNWPIHWTGRDMSQRCKDLGSFFYAAYLQLYSAASWQVHSGNASYADVKPEDFGRLVGVFTNVARQLYIRSIKSISGAFKLSEKMTNLNEVLELLNDAPRELLLEFLIQQLNEESKANSLCDDDPG